MRKRHFKSPSELIREDMRDLGCSQTDIAVGMRVHRAIVSKLINGKLAITPDRARQLQSVTGRDAWEYFEAQAWVWFESAASEFGLARKRPRKPKGSGKTKPEPVT